MRFHELALVFSFLSVPLSLHLLLNLVLLGLKFLFSVFSDDLLTILVLVFDSLLLLLNLFLFAFVIVYKGGFELSLSLLLLLFEAFSLLA